MSTTPEICESTILNRVIDRDDQKLPAKVALEILKWGFPTADQEKMSQLAMKARVGELSEEESGEIEAYERVSSFLGMIKSKARKSLHAMSSK